MLTNHIAYFSFYKWKNIIIQFNDYVQLSSELDEEIVNNMKNEIEDFISKEDVLSLNLNYNVITPYINYKLSN
jgi:hypothetical protein